jgi:hypothetical protein
MFAVVGERHVLEPISCPTGAVATTVLARDLHRRVEEVKMLDAAIAACRMLNFGQVADRRKNRRDTAETRRAR